MDIQAAVAFTAGNPLSLETVTLEPPQAGEVLIEIKATGVCHTDAYTLSGADPEGLFPAILGHEGAGVVVEVGVGVTSLKPGDHVIPLYTPECRNCEYCLSQKTNLCQAIRSTQGRGVMPNGTSRFSIDGTMIHHYMGTSTFANYTVLPEIAVAKIREDAPFEKVWPGQKALAMRSAISLNTASSLAADMSTTWTISGLKSGRPFAA